MYSLDSCVIPNLLCHIVSILELYRLIYWSRAFAQNLLAALVSHLFHSLIVSFHLLDMLLGIYQIYCTCFPKTWLRLAIAEMVHLIHWTLVVTQGWLGALVSHVE